MLINQALGQAAISVLCVSAALYAARCNRNATECHQCESSSYSKETALLYLGMQELFYYWTDGRTRYLISYKAIECSAAGRRLVVGCNRSLRGFRQRNRKLLS